MRILRLENPNSGHGPFGIGRVFDHINDSNRHPTPWTFFQQLMKRLEENLVEVDNLVGHFNTFTYHGCASFESFMDWFGYDPFGCYYLNRAIEQYQNGWANDKIELMVYEVDRYAVIGMSDSANQIIMPRENMHLVCKEKFINLDENKIIELCKSTNVSLTDESVGHSSKTTLLEYGECQMLTTEEIGIQKHINSLKSSNLATV